MGFENKCGHIVKEVWSDPCKPRMILGKCEMRKKMTMAMKMTARLSSRRRRFALVTDLHVRESRLFGIIHFMFNINRGIILGVSVI